MLNRLQRLWLKGIKRVGKAQKSQTKQLVKSLLKAAKKKVVVKAKPKPKPKPRTRSKPKELVSKTPLSLLNAPVKRPAPAIAAAPEGLWSKFYYTTSLVDNDTVSRRMEYWLFLPDGVTKASMPLVVMLHGCDQTALQFAQGTRMNLLAGKKGFAVLYAQQSRTANPGRCWNWYKTENQEGGGEAKMIVGAIHNVIRKFPIDPTRVYIGGMSAGASMASIIAMQFPNFIAAVGMHSGAVLGSANSPLGALTVMQRGGRVASSNQAKPERILKMPAIFIHGQSDYVVRTINMTQAAQKFCAMNQLSGDSADAVISDHPRVTGTTPSRHAYRTLDFYVGKKLTVRVCEVSQLEHAWSGGDCSLRFNDCDGPDASLMMWNFFRLHRRLGAISTAL